MADSQPGKVITFDPSITLASFTADARDRLMYNENQLVIAKIQQPVPVSAISYLDAGGPVYNNYVNVSGQFAYTDGSFQALKTSGVPTTPVDIVEIGYNQQITTSVIKFWSTSFVTIASLTAEYSFDNVTWFTVGTITWVETRDESLEQYPGDSPPSGEYVYEGTFDDGPQSARYWRLEHTLPFVNDLTEIEILPNVGATLEHWGSDGTKAVTNQIEGDSYLDVTYDKADNVYYAIKYDDTLPTSLVLDPDDSFDSLTDGSLFDKTKWVESLDSPYFIRSTSSGTLDMKSSAGDGQLSTNYSVSGDFTSNIDVVAAVKLNTKAYFGLETKDNTTGNQYTLTALQGEYTPGVDTASAKFVSAYAEYNNTVGGSAVLQSFRLKPDGIDFVTHNNSTIVYSFIFDAAAGNYIVTASGVTTWPDAEPGVPYTAMDSAGFTISNLSTPSDGQGFTVNVRCKQDTVVGTATSGISLQFERIGTNGYLRYQDSDVPGYLVSQVANVPVSDMRMQIYGSPVNQEVDIGADNFSVTGGTLNFSSPVFSVVTLNKDGNLEQVPSVSDADGFALKIFDVIQDLSGAYNDYLYPKVSIATNGELHGLGGEVYIKVEDKLYKYLKSALPLASDDGSGAAVTTTGEIPATNITSFSYNGYTQGGLSYIEYVPGLGGTFVKTLSSNTLLSQPEKVFLDIPTDDFQFAWNVVDLSTLYYVEGTALKLYDLNETKAAFANVSSDKQVLAAGTQESTIVTAQILNVYGEPKSNKTMTFTVSAGDGAISPAIGCSDVDGEDTTVYTVGAAVGATTITVTVSDLSCV